MKPDPNTRAAPAHEGRLRVALLTTVAMLAFAANSVLCRLALGRGLIDAATFSSVRAMAGAATLGLVLSQRAVRPR